MTLLTKAAPANPPPAIPLPNDIRTLVRVVKNPSAFLLDLSSSAGDIGMLRAGPLQIVCVNHPALVYETLVEKARHFRKMPAVKTLSAFTGDGLLVNDADVWARHRKLAAPAFHHQRIVAYQRVVADAVGDLIAGWRDGERIDVEKTFKQLTLRIIGRALFNVELDEVAPGLGHDIDTALRYVNTLAGMAVYPLGRHFVPNARAGRAAIKRVDTAVRTLIARRRAGQKDHGDLLSMFMLARSEDGAGLSDAEVRDEIITMFVAGHETVATVMTWSVLMIARHNPVFETLHREASQALGGAQPTFETLARMPFAAQTYKETMRLYPGGFTIGRQAIENVEIGGHHIPRDAWVMVSPYSVQRMPGVFAEPERFDPSRFAGDAEKSWPRGAYLPFGLGARTCIGGQFALMEGHTIISALTQAVRFHDETNGPVGIRPLIALSPDRPVIMRIERLLP
jgi:cytochrome P450